MRTPLALVAVLLTAPLWAQDPEPPPVPPPESTPKQPKAPDGPKRPQHAKQLVPVAKVALGNFMGAVGASSGSLSGAWALNYTTVVLKTRRGRLGRTESERMWVFTWDSEAKALRCRIVGEGRVITCAVTAAEAEGEASLSLTETAREGPTGAKLSLSLKRTAQQLTITEARATWTLAPLRRSPTQRGPFPLAAMKLKIPLPGGKAFLPAQIHHPKRGKKPFPVVVLSPGGKAPKPRGYEYFAQYYASWGWVVVVVGFGDTPAEERAKRFGYVADWLKVSNAQPAWALSGAFQLKTLVAAGHSRGGHAALLAAQQDPRFTACLALAPAGPKSLGEGLKKPVAFLSGEREVRHCQSLYQACQPPKLQVAIRGMDHFFRPADRARHVLSHSIAFLEGIVRGHPAYAHWLELSRQRGVGIAIKRK